MAIRVNPLATRNGSDQFPDRNRRTRSLLEGSNLRLAPTGYTEPTSGVTSTFKDKEITKMAVTPLPEPSLTLLDGRLFVRHMEFAGAIVQVVEQHFATGGSLAGAEELVRVAETIGGEALLMGQGRLAVLSMAQEIDRLVATTKEGADGIPQAVLAEVKPLLAELAGLLGHYFDGTQTTSVQEQIKSLLEASHAGEIKRVIGELLAEDGPLAARDSRLTTQIKLVGEPVNETLTRVHEVLVKLEGRLQADEVMDRSSIKGRPFQEIAHVELDAIFSQFGDEVIYVGDQPGAVDGSNAGDFVVRLNPNTAGGRDGLRLVIEAKTGKLYRPAAFRELESGIVNREAEAGVIVFDEIADAPLGGREFGSMSDRMFVAVLDKNTLHPLALEAACRFARGLAVERGGDAATQLDSAWLAEQVEALRSIIEASRPVRSGLGIIRNGVSKTEDACAAMIARARDLLTSFENRLGGHGDLEIG